MEFEKKIIMIFTNIPLETFVPSGYMSSFEYYEFENDIFSVKSYPGNKVMFRPGYYDRTNLEDSREINWLESIYMILMYYNPSEEALEFLMTLREEFLSFEFVDLCPYQQNYLNFVMKFYS